MTSIELVGWFSDLPHGRADGPRLRDSLDALSPEDAAVVAEYLELGTVIAETTGGVLTDQLDPETPTIGRYRTLTDGHFVWPSDFPYYVRKYRVAVPDSLLNKAQGGRPRPLTDGEIDAVVDALLG
ncbi:MAG: hypothetical protein IRY85_13935 [Micromonosporaceae bacterium]|nr:hypothetical protein [Micromonosporaceae bacterium]